MGVDKKIPLVSATIGPLIASKAKKPIVINFSH